MDNKHEISFADFSKHYMKNSFESMPGGFFVYRADGDEEILYANQNVLDIFECENEEQFKEYTNGSFKGLVHKDDIEEAEKNIWTQIENKSDNFDHIYYRIITRRGKIRYIEDFGRLVNDPEEGRLFYVFIVEVRNKYLAFDTDDLTGLPGRRRFLDYCNRVLSMENGSNPTLYSFVYFNIINFKAINVTYGDAEGDVFLKMFTRLLHNVFVDNYCSRFSEDHFVICTETEGLMDRLEELYAQFISVRNLDIVDLKAGIYHVHDRRVSPAVACDYAKYASDYIRDDISKYYCVYEFGMEHRNELENYLIKNLDRAIDKGEIRVYYQPVLRTLTNKLCGKEALTRWIDAEKGFLSPGMFVPVLEKHNLIHKLDIYAVSCVCRDLRAQIDAGEIVVPVSFNLSKLDFVLCNPYEEVEALAQRFDIPREYLCVEITESVLMDNKESIKSQVDLFHNAGYKVWIDDFGSGYSGLNLLKDFNFDELKIDMLFLSTLNERSKGIISSIVYMAKKMGINTLAEGVETQEQLQYLLSIGCQKIQGYYYGRPQPNSSVREQISAGTYDPENSKDRNYFEQVDKTNIITSRSRALLEFSDNKFKYYYVNNEYMEALTTKGRMDVVASERALNDPTNPMYLPYRRFTKQAKVTGEEQIANYTDEGQTMRVKAVCIAKDEDRCMMKVSLENLHIAEHKDRINKVDSYIRALSNYYETARIIHPEADYAEELMTYGSYTNFGARVDDVKNMYRLFANANVHGDDYDEFISFMNPDTMFDRIMSSGYGFVAKSFRCRDIQSGSGDFVSKTFILVRTIDEDDAIVEFSRRNMESDEKYSEHSDSVDKSMLWDSLMKVTSDSIFWRDKDRHIQGASDKLLRLLKAGKLDNLYDRAEDDDSIKNYLENGDENDVNVLKYGRIYNNIHVKRQFGDKTFDLIESKFPVYVDGKIEGIIDIVKNSHNTRGLFYMLEDDSIDTLTQLIKPEAKDLLADRFAQNYYSNKADYAVGLIEVDGVNQLYASYGDIVGDKLVSAIGDIIRKNLSFMAAGCRLSNDRYMLYVSSSDEESTKKHLKTIVGQIQDIDNVDGIRCELSVKYSMAFASEAGDQTVLNKMLKQRLRTADVSDGLYDRFEEGEEVPDDVNVFMDIPTPIAVFRVITDGQSDKIVDTEIIYVNNCYCNMVGIPRTGLVGKSFLNTVPNATPMWFKYCHSAAILRQTVSDRIYSPESRHWTNFVVAPARGKNCCTFAFMNTDVEHEENVLLERKFMVNDVVLRIARLLSGNEDYKQAINNVLIELSIAIHPERVYILDRGETYTSRTFEWCADGVEPMMSYMQEQLNTDYISWKRYLEYDNCVVISDVESIKDSRDKFYRVLKGNNIYRFIAVPINDQGVIIGYICADNYDPDDKIDVRLLLETVAPFIGARVSNHRLLVKLDNMSTHDALTGTNNRNALYEIERRLAASKRTAGVIFVDLNELKNTNDKEGHDAGDALLINVGRLLKNCFGKAQVFRAGGDEFVVIIPDISEGEMSERWHEFNKIVAEHPEINVSKGYSFCEDTRDIIESVKAADENMYLDKIEYYKKNDRRR
ncbi:MAG: EAL domain-containing protein [Lachnospiraceae bacterium]|nr:EAL domain-containing protein [Lachnospiraceae bacterium]